MKSKHDLLQRERTLKLISVLVVIAVTITIVLTVDNMLVSFVLAFVTTYLLAPIVNLLERKGLPRNLAVLIPFLMTAVLVGLGIYLVLPMLTAQFSALESQIPVYQQDIINLVTVVEAKIKAVMKLHDVSISHNLNMWLLEKTTELSVSLPSIISASLTTMVLAPFLAFFMLQDGRDISRKLLSMVPNNFFELALFLHHRINQQMGDFVRARFLEAAIVGGVVWFGLAVYDFPYAPLLALFAGVTNLIPYIGPIIGAIPAVLIALISPEALVTPSLSLNLFLVTSVYFLAQLIDIAFIIPLVVARIVNLHPVTVVIVIILGAQIMGILGMVISIPAASVIKVTINAVFDYLLDPHV